MSVSRFDGDPSANRYAQPKRAVLDRVPHITAIEYVPDDIEATQARVMFDPTRLDPPTGPDPPEPTIKRYRQNPRDWFRSNYTDPNTGFHAGWHRNEDHSDLGRIRHSDLGRTRHSDLGRTRFQYSLGDDEERWGIAFEHETPSPSLREIVEALLGEGRPDYQYGNEEP